MIFGLIVSFQKELIEKHCFGTCGKILVGGGFDGMLGEIALCKEKICPHLDKQMDEAIGELNNEPLYMRKLKTEEFGEEWTDIVDTGEAEAEAKERYGKG